MKLSWDSHLITRSTVLFSVTWVCVRVFSTRIRISLHMVPGRCTLVPVALWISACIVRDRCTCLSVFSYAYQHVHVHCSGARACVCQCGRVSVLWKDTFLCDFCFREIKRIRGGYCRNRSKQTTGGGYYSASLTVSYITPERLCCVILELYTAPENNKSFGCFMKNILINVVPVGSGAFVLAYVAFKNMQQYIFNFPGSIYTSCGVWRVCCDGP